LILGNLNTNKSAKGSEWENLTAPAQSQQTQPAKPATPSSDIPQ
jgi:preprotein translocase subunit SecG